LPFWYCFFWQLLEGIIEILNVDPRIIFLLLEYCFAYTKNILIIINDSLLSSRVTRIVLDLNYK
jgi:hypothetical protein